MNENFDPYREALVVEAVTIWPEELAHLGPADRAELEKRLHAEPEQATQLEYVRLPAGFCRRITVRPEDIQRLRPARLGQ